MGANASLKGTAITKPHRLADLYILHPTPANGQFASVPLLPHGQFSLTVAPCPTKVFTNTPLTDARALCADYYHLYRPSAAPKVLDEREFVKRR